MRKKQPTDLDRERRRYARRRTIKRIAVLLVMAAAAALLYGLRFEIASQGIGVLLSDTADLLFQNEGYPVTLEDEPIQLLPVGRRVAVVSQQGLSVYNKAGNKAIDRHTANRNLVAVSVGRYLLTYVSGGYELSVWSGPNELFSTRFDHPIYTAALAENGAFAVSTGAVGDQSCVTAYDATHRQVLVWASSDQLVNTLALDPKASALAVGSLSSDQGTLCSAVRLFNLSGDGSIRGQTEFSDELLLALQLREDGTCTAVTDRGVRVLSHTAALRGKCLTDGVPLTAFLIREDGSGTIACGDYDANHETTLKAFGTDGTQTASAELTDRVKGLYDYEGAILAFTGERIVRYSDGLVRMSAFETPGALQAAVVGESLYYTTVRELCRTTIR